MKNRSRESEEAVTLPRECREELKREFQPELHFPRVSGAQNRVSVDDVRRGAPATEAAGDRGVVAKSRVDRSAVWIGQVRVIGDVKELRAELGREPLPKPEVLKQGEIQIAEARVAENVPAHSPEGIHLGRNHHG